MNKRSELLRRLMSAQIELRRASESMVSPGLQAEFAAFGGLTLQQVEVVHRLLEGGRMTMHEVAQAHGIGASGATQLVDRLEHRGLVNRIRDDRDRRVQLVVPTRRAQDLARRFGIAMGRAAVKYLAVLNDRELETYVELTERIAEAWRRSTDRPVDREDSE
jgi:DNA-binding MarR family transcriptional regulator